MRFHKMSIFSLPPLPPIPPQLASCARLCPTFSISISYKKQQRQIIQLRWFDKKLNLVCYFFSRLNDVSPAFLSHSTIHFQTVTPPLQSFISSPLHHLWPCFHSCQIPLETHTYTPSPLSAHPFLPLHLCLMTMLSVMRLTQSTKHTHTHINVMLTPST